MNETWRSTPRRDRDDSYRNAGVRKAPRTLSLSSTRALDSFMSFMAFDREAYTVTKGEITKFDLSPGKTADGLCVQNSK